MLGALRKQFIDGQFLGRRATRGAIVGRFFHGVAGSIQGICHRCGLLTSVSINAFLACAEAVLWAWVRMGEIIKSQTKRTPGPIPKELGAQVHLIADIAQSLNVSRDTVKRYQLAARLNEQADFDARPCPPSRPRGIVPIVA